MGRACSKHGNTRNKYKIFIVKSEGKGSLGKPWSRSEYNIKMDDKETRVRGCGLDQWWAPVIMVMNIGSIKGGEFV
jgi:hypothetical protein